jgi:hypothetical protein
MCEHRPQPVVPTPRISRLAVVGVVLAFIPMCIPLNLLGSLMGLIAKRRVGVSAGSLGGGRAATLAIWGGVLMTLAGWWAWGAAGDWADRAMKQSVSATVTSFLTDVSDGNTAAALRYWSTDATPPTEQAISRFAESFQAMGEVQGVGVKSMQPMEGDNPLQPRWSAWIVVTAGEATWDGAAVVDIVAGSAAFELRGTLTRIAVTGPSGEISLGGDEAAASPPEDPATP